MNHEEKLEYYKNWNKNHPKQHSVCNQKWRENHRDKDRVHHNGYKKSVLGKECEFCGVTEKLVRHHFDYLLPTITVTCCNSCHKWIHIKEITE